MNIPDLPTWNQVNTCCCGFPTCEAPTSLCESLSHTSTCADDDYTDALRVWTEALELWVNEPIVAWQADLAAWLAADPDRVAADYPVPMPDPRNPDDYTVPEPVKSDYYENYDDVTHGCYLPYVRPTGADTDEVPTIYRTYKHVLSDLYSGDSYNYQGIDFGGGAGVELLGHSSFADNIETYTSSGNETDGATCTALVDPTTEQPVDFLYPTYVEGEPSLVCTASSRVYSREDTSVSEDYSVPLTLSGCASVPFTDQFKEAWDFTRSYSDTQTLGLGISKADLISRAGSNIPSTWPTTTEGTACIASASATWPIISDGFIGADPDADPPVMGHWPTCAEDQLIAAIALVDATKVRYKRGIPLKYQAHRLWIIAHAEWVIAHAAWVAAGSDPETEPIEPVEPQIFHYYAEQWDVVKFPKKWEAWRVLWFAWKAAVKAHDDWDVAHAAWVAAGSPAGSEPVEPTVPPDPTADQPAERPTFIDENLFWEWTGGETLESQYEATWRTIDAPASEAQIRIVNSQVKCFKSTRTGVPPTPFGEIYNPDDYPA